jgi:ribosomal protein S2
MAQHRWNRIRRRRYAEREREERRVEVIDRSGSERHLERAAKSLKHVNAMDRVLYVPQWDMAKAELAMRKAGVSGAVSNLCGTRRKLVRSGRGR